MLKGTHVETCRHSHFLIPRFLARALLGHTLPMYARAVKDKPRGRQHPLLMLKTSSAIQPLPTGRGNFIGTSSQRSELLLLLQVIGFCSPLGNPYLVCCLVDTHFVQEKRNEKTKSRTTVRVDFFNLEEKKVISSQNYARENHIVIKYLVVRRIDNAMPCHHTDCFRHDTHIA